MIQEIQRLVRRIGLPLAIVVASALSTMHERYAGAAEVDVYVLTGQSNSLGTTADNSESNIGPGVEASDAATRFFWSNASAANTAYPISAMYGNSGGAITPLQAQQGDGGAHGLLPSTTSPISI
jgi:hypothetical protein